MKMDELKSCPFCGGNAYTHISYKIHSHKVRYVVKCSKCNANMEYRSEDAAIVAWNRRVNND